MAAKKKAAKAKKVVKKKVPNRTAQKKTVARKSAKKTVRKVVAKARTNALRARVEADLAALPVEAQRYPGEPVMTKVAYALRLVDLAKSSRSKLARLPGFDLWHLDRLREAAVLLAELEGQWDSARSRSRAGLTPAKIRKAERLRSNGVASIRYLLRNDPVVQQRVDDLMQGDGIADLAGDLRGVAAIHLEFPELFEQDETIPKDFPKTLMTIAGEVAVGLNPIEAAEAQTTRNRAYWLLDESVKEVAAALRYLWRSDDAKLATLGDSYAARVKRSYRAKKKEAGGGSGGGPIPLSQ